MATQKHARKGTARVQKGHVAAAAMSAGAGGGLGGVLTGKMIEDAMGKAHMDALGKGIVDDAKILKLKLAARDRLVAEHNAAQAKAAKAAKR